MVNQEECKKYIWSNYVAGFFDGEGCVGKNIITLTNTDIELINKIIEYLSFLGIKSKIKMKTKYSNHKQGYDVAIYGYKNLRVFQKEIPFVSKDKTKKLETMLNNSTCFRMSKVDKEKIKILHNNGLSYRKIAKLYNVGHATIGRYYNER